jgi:mannose-1-phosphate guanylyltransferase
VPEGDSITAALLDVGGTLIECRPSPAAVYARVLSRFGPPVEEREVAPVFRQVWSEMTLEHPPGLDRYHRLKGAEWEWWGRFLERVLAGLGHGAPAGPVLEELFAAFAEPSLWHVFPEVPEVLHALRERRLRLAVVSNWDSRLPELLDRVGLSGYFDAVLVSSLEGIEKPAPEIFLRAAERLGVEPAACAHVGDSPLDDYRGAESAGMLPILVDRTESFADGFRRVSDLRGVAVIMAGGSGTRFWPLSRRRRPKQLLPLLDGRSLLAATVERVLPLAGRERTIVVTCAEVAAAVREDVPDVPAENVLAEPAGRDTAACIGWVAWRLAERHPGAVMLVIPADHVIPDGAAFRSAMAAAASTAYARGGLVTVGFRPTRPETGYGYLELGESAGMAGAHEVSRVARFVEKPAREAAERMLAAGTFRWNGGLFAWSVAAIRDAIRAHLPELAAALDAMMADAAAIGEAAALARHYAALPKISIDFGVMEKAATVWAVSAEFAWSDVGSWVGLSEVLDAGAGELHLGDVLAADTEGNVLVSDGPMVAALGVRDLVVVATRDAVLVVPRELCQRVKELVEMLRASGRDDLL